MFRLSLLFLGIAPVLALAQSNPGPAIASMGLTGVVAQNVWSLQANQAGLAKLAKPVISAAVENKFFDPAIHTASFVAAYPFGRNVVGISFQGYGFSVYKEQKIGFAYAKSFGPNLFAALNINYHQLKIDQYGETSTFSVEGGLQFQATERLLLAAHVANPSRGNFKEEGRVEIPIVGEVGASYRFSSKIHLNTAFVKVLDTDLDVRCGLSYFLNDWFVLRGGYSLRPMRHYAGFGLHYQKICIDMAVSSHQSLGYSPQVALTYEF